MKTTNKNFLYNVLYQIFSFLIPLITTPYISRVLGAENIGIYSYTYSIAYYFLLASMLGINNYGAREIAKRVKNKEEMSKKFLSIYYLQLIMNFIMIFLYFIFINFISYQHKNILYIQLIFLLANALDVNWFFFGQEEFKITISRNIIIKILSLIFIFLFVKSPSDLCTYTFIMSTSTFISQAYLWFFVKKKIVKCKLLLKDIFANFKPCLVLFIPVVAYSIYRVMDKTMIGFFAGELELGYYESAEKIINIPLSFISALGTVIMPNITKSNENEFNRKFCDAFYLIYFIILPMVFGLLVVSKDFTNLFFGAGYFKTANIIIYLLPTVIVGATTNLVRSSYLIPKSLNKVYIISTSVGAAVNLLLNLIFIPLYGAYGACIGTVVAEFVVLFFQFGVTKDNLEYGRCIKMIIPLFYKTSLIFIILILLNILISNNNIRLLLQVVISVICYFALNYRYIVCDFLGIKKSKID